MAEQKTGIQEQVRMALLRSGLEIPAIVDLEGAEKIIEALKEPESNYPDGEDLKFIIDFLANNKVPTERIRTAALGVLLGVFLTRIGFEEKKRRGGNG